LDRIDWTSRVPASDIDYYIKQPTGYNGHGNGHGYGTNWTLGNRVAINSRVFGAMPVTRHTQIGVARKSGWWHTESMLIVHNHPT
jgi:hypothetical protein